MQQDPFKFTITSIAKLKPSARRYEVADTEIPSFRLRVMPSGVMTYSVLYRNEQGRRVRYTIGRHGALTLEQARHIARQKLAKVELGEDPQADKRRAREQSQIPTLAKYVDGEYGDWAHTHQKSPLATIKRLKSTFGELFGNTAIDKISAWNVEKWRSRRLKAGIKATTVNRDITALKAALNKAVEWQLLDNNPVAKVKAVKTDTRPKVRYLDSDEEKCLYAALEARDRRTGDYLKPMVLLSMNTGMRRGELFNLTWENVNLPLASLTIEAGGTKNKTTRHIPLNTAALEALRTWRDRQTDTSGHVFKGRNGERFDNIKRSWASLLAKARIKNFRWHDVRHHFASKLVMAGVDLNTVRELLGHGDIKMTLRYAHLAPDYKAQAVARLVSS